MVRKGIFSAVLVHADTKIPFKEHVGPDGSVYAEVEPDMDYFIMLCVHDMQDGEGVSVTSKVDGECLGYKTMFWYCAGKWAVNGIPVAQNGESRQRALRFAKTEGLSRPDSMGPSFGSVQLTFTAMKMTDDTPIRNYDFVNSWVGGKTLVDAAISEKTGKVVTSKEGRMVETGQQTQLREHVEGETLATIEIQYCTTVGLIMVGVLPKPPGWESRDKRLKKTLSSSMKKCLAVEPLSIVLTHENVAWGQEEVRADCFDLIEADVSDDEEATDDDFEQCDTDLYPKA